MRYIAWLWRLSHGIRWNTSVRVTAGILQVVLGLLMVWLSRHFIDETIRTGTTDDVFRMVIWLVLTIVGSILLRQLYFYLTTVATVKQTNALRLRIYSSLFRRQLFDDKTIHSGDVSSRLAKDIETVSTVSCDTLPQMLITTLQLCGAFLLMRWFDERLAWALLLLTPLAIVFGKLISRRLRQMTLNIRETESRIQVQVQESMEYNDLLRSMGSEHWVTNRLRTVQERYRGHVLKRTRFTVVIRIIMSCVFGLGYLLAFVWGGLGLRNGTITFGVMTSFLQLVGMIQGPIMQLLNLIPGVIHATASIDRLEELSAPSQDTFVANRQFQLTPPLGVRIQDISFRYAAGDREVLSHFSHDFKPGTKTAIVGETGIGKTTLFRLMLGFIQPDAGTIQLYNSEEAQSIGTDTRSHFVFVPQGNQLMSGSISYNLRLAQPDATDAELQQVLHIACADFVNDLPEGLHTYLGEHGGGLSEGQAQRIAIARALLRPGSILLLDEISSALDEDTERELYARLMTFCPDKTMLFITHRPAVYQLCDEVLRLASYN